MQYMAHRDFDESAQKKGSVELLVLAQLEGRPRHGYEIGVEIERRSEGAVSFQTASLYPVLYRLEQKGLIAAQGGGAPGKRRGRDSKLTSPRGKMLSQNRRTCGAFLSALRRASCVE